MKKCKHPYHYHWVPESYIYDSAVNCLVAKPEDPAVRLRCDGEYYELARKLRIATAALEQLKDLGNEINSEHNPDPGSEICIIDICNTALGKIKE